MCWLVRAIYTETRAIYTEHAQKSCAHSLFAMNAFHNYIYIYIYLVEAISKSGCRRGIISLLAAHVCMGMEVTGSKQN